MVSVDRAGIPPRLAGSDPNSSPALRRTLSGRRPRQVPVGAGRGPRPGRRTRKAGCRVPCLRPGRRAHEHAAEACVLPFTAGRDRPHRPDADLAVPPGRNELIAYGPLLSDDGATWLGTAVLVRARDADTARAILTPDRYAGIEVHGWQFGGR